MTFVQKSHNCKFENSYLIHRPWLTQALSESKWDCWSFTCVFANVFIRTCDPQIPAASTSHLVCTSSAAAQASLQRSSFSILLETPRRSPLCLSSRRTCTQLPSQVHGHIHTHTHSTRLEGHCLHPFWKAGDAKPGSSTSVSSWSDWVHNALKFLFLIVNSEVLIWWPGTSQHSD